METDVLRHYIGMEVEILVSGVWIEGRLQPIVKGVITLIPVGEAGVFYGPCACKTEVVQAIRQVKRSGQKMADPVPEAAPTVNVRSSLDSVTPGQRFKRNQ